MQIKPIETDQNVVGGKDFVTYTQSQMKRKILYISHDDHYDDIIITCMYTIDLTQLV